MQFLKKLKFFSGACAGGASGQNPCRKKESIASIIVDTKESLKTPLIIQTQSIGKQIFSSKFRH